MAKAAWSRKNLWEKAPPSVKATAGRLLACVPTQFWLGRRFRETCRFLDESQRWSAEQIRAYQLRELVRVCRIAYENAPFYREWFDVAGLQPQAIKSPGDLRRLPTIDKETIRENLERMCTVPTDSPNVDFVSTGGTGGNPLHFYMGSGRSAIEYAYLVTSWRRIGYDLHLPMAVFRGRVVPPGRNGLRHTYDPVLRHHVYSTFHMTDENMGRYLEHVARIGPCFLHVYPSSVATLAKFVRRTGFVAPTNVRGIIAESEIVYPEQRELAEQVFGCRYFSCYGHTEKLVLASECEHSTDCHIWPTYGYFELLDKEGEPVTTPGERGEIVGTGFMDTVVPFIRYRTGDWATYIGERCEQCGRAHPVLRDIRGHRTQEVLIAADGAEISWTAMNMHDDTFLRVRQFQFRQEKPGEALLRIVPTAEFDDREQARMLAHLQRKFDGRLRVEVEITDSLPLSPRGKAIYVEQLIDRTNPRPAGAAD